MRLLPLLCCVLLTACALALPGRDDRPAPPVANPITGDAIATTTLEAPVAQPEAPVVKPEASVERVTPVVIASPQETACLKKGGSWGKAGKTGGKTCFMQTRDSGKSCQRESDCEAFCLARSGTCAPVSPMFGCNEILQDNGVMVTLCID
jgi:hypothetical protein